jgi:hypothetical protein
MGQTEPSDQFSQTLTHKVEDGISFCENAGWRFMIVMPSRLRQHWCHGHFWFEHVNLTIHESEVDAYEEEFARVGKRPATVWPHKELSLARVFNWMLDTIYDEDKAAWVLLCDDDQRGLFWRYSHLPVTTAVITDPQKLADITTNLAQMAVALPTGFFGYPIQCHVSERTSMKPFRLRALIPTSHCGVIGKKVRWDSYLVDHDDWDLSLAMLAYWRVTLLEMRYGCWNIQTNSRIANDPGGMAGQRTSELIMREQNYLIEKWGPDVIQHGSSRARGQGMAITIRIPQHYKAPTVKINRHG